MISHLPKNPVIIIITAIIVVVFRMDNSFCEGLNFIGEPKELAAVEGDDIELECRLDETAEDPHLYWMRGPTVYATATESFYPLKNVRRKGSSFFMNIREVKVDDGGEYMCQVPVPGGQAMTYVQNLTVNVPPSIKPFQHPILEVDESFPLNIFCEVQGKPDPVVSWLKLKKNSAKEEIMSTSAMLFIPSANPHSAGVYECRADNLVRSPAVQSVKVVVHHKPRCWSPSNKVTTGPGYSSTMECTCSSHSHITWYHNDQPIRIVDRPNMLRKDDTSSDEGHLKSIIRIKDTKDSDLGQYMCTGSNRMGSANHSIVLSAKPANVKIMSLRAKNTHHDRFALEWTVTSFAKLTSFIVTIHQIEGRTRHLLTNMTIQPRNQQLPTKTSNNYHNLMANHFQSDYIIGLPPTSNFSIQMLAVNEYGTSPWSDVGYFNTVSSGYSTREISIYPFILLAVILVCVSD